MRKKTDSHKRVRKLELRRETLKLLTVKSSIRAGTVTGETWVVCYSIGCPVMGSLEGCTRDGCTATPAAPNVPVLPGPYTWECANSQRVTCACPHLSGYPMQLVYQYVATEGCTGGWACL